MKLQNVKLCLHALPAGCSLGNISVAVIDLSQKFLFLQVHDDI